MAADVVETVNVPPEIAAVNPAGFAPIVYEIELAPGKGINDGVGEGEAVGVLLRRGVGEIDGVGEADGTT
jgi:hypothetical protein